MHDTEIVAWTYDADIYCLDCYAKLPKQAQKEANPIFAGSISEMQNEEGVGVGCTANLGCGFGWIEEPTEEYLFKKKAKETELLGIIPKHGEEGDYECLVCMIKMRDYEPEHTQLFSSTPGADTFTCWDCEKQLVQQRTALFKGRR